MSFLTNLKNSLYDIASGNSEQVIVNRKDLAELIEHLHMEDTGGFMAFYYITYETVEPNGKNHKGSINLRHPTPLNDEEAATLIQSAERQSRKAAINANLTGETSVTNICRL